LERLANSFVEEFGGTNLEKLDETAYQFDFNTEGKDAVATVSRDEKYVTFLAIIGYHADVDDILDSIAEYIPEDDTDQQADVPTLTDAEIKAMYRKARQAYDWFAVGTMSTGGSDSKEVDGHYYWKVKHAEIASMADLTAYLNSIFTEDITTRLLGNSNYRDLDGALYAIPADGGGDRSKGAEAHEITKVSNTEIAYRVSVNILEFLQEEMEYGDKVVGTEVHNFRLIFKNGKWRFSSFGPM
jgi:hypothetical protein